MSLSDAYASPGLYRNLIHKSDPGQDEDVRGDLEAVSRYLEYKLHQYFNKTDDLEVRYFDAPTKVSPLPAWSSVGWAESENPYRYLQGGPYIDIEPICDITGLIVQVDTNRDLTYPTTLTASEYVLLPRNALTGPEPKPYSSIIKPNQSNWAPGAGLKITAIWGWPSVPKAIQRACVHLTAILRIESPRATNSIDNMDNVVGASKECQDILHNIMKPYRRQPSFGGSGTFL